MNSSKRLLILVTCVGLGPIWLATIRAQDNSPPSIVKFTTKEDHQNMLTQLGITRLRPGPNGNESAPNHANYDEALANPFPKLPELLVCLDGAVVNTKEEWIERRRPEIVELFEKEVIGRIPATTPKVTWNVLEEKEITIGEIPLMETTLEGVVDVRMAPARYARFSSPPFSISRSIASRDSCQSGLGLCLSDPKQRPTR